jgi:hypothetical protein
MKISKSHQNFVYTLQGLHVIPKQDVLDHTEKYLGPNWEAVINFWLYFDTLTEEQLEVVIERYYMLNVEELRIIENKVWSVLNAARDTTKHAYEAIGFALHSVSSFYCAKVAVAYATLELIGLEKLLDQGYQPVFFPMLLNL